MTWTVECQCAGVTILLTLSTLTPPDQSQNNNVNVLFMKIILRTFLADCLPGYFVIRSLLLI